MQFGLSASLFNTAYEHHQAGRLAEADHACRQALGIDPRNADALHLLGVIAGQSGAHQDSLTLIDQALAVSPKFAEAHANRGVALMALGRGAEAVAAFQQSIRLKPEHVLAHYGLGNALGNQGDLDGAVKAFRQALAIAPNFVEAQNNLAMALQQQDKLDEALEGFRKASAMGRPSAQLQYNLGVTLHLAGRPQEAVGAFEAALALKPDYVQAHSNLLLARNYLSGSAQDLIEAHRDFDRRHARPLRPSAPTWRNEVDPERRLRIGYLSGDFSTHPVGYLLAGPLAAHDPAQVEVFCYSNDSRPDAMTERLRASAHHWRDIAGRSDGTASPLIREDEIDILVDLSGHTDKNRPLALARRAAPIQVSWLGYAGTTGLESVDYAIMDRWVAPDGAEAWFTEALVRLPHSRFCYSPPDFAPEPKAVSDRAGAPVVFGSFNNLAKIGPEVVVLWARVLDAVPGSRLVLKWKALNQPGVRQRVAAAFAAHGVGPDRLELRERSPHADMLAEYGDIDVALDPFPYSGGATSAEALWMGVPVVTLPSDRVAARQTLGFLAELDLQDLAAASPDDYVRIAAALAADPARRADLRRTLRGRMRASPLTDAKAFTPGLEQAYRQMWRRWCEGQPPQAINVA
jgi:predicted O-linked N-acetylglucosamine transferase (SPINDLY family)